MNLLEQALLTENFYRLLCWLMEYVELRKKPNGSALPAPPYQLPAIAFSGRLAIERNNDPGLKTFHVKYSMTLIDGTIYQVYFFHTDTRWIVSGADCSHPNMDRESPDDPVGGWFPEQLVHAMKCVSDGVPGDRVIPVQNLIER